MNIFEVLVVAPIFNLLMALYAIIPGKDFGVALILFAILVRIVMWPYAKKQLHQTKLMRKIQPELAKIKAKTKGNKQLEGQMMMELYKKHGVNPFSAFTVLLIQMPILIALFSVIKIVTSNRGEIAKFTYGFIEQLGPVKEVITNHAAFNESLFSFIDLTKHALGSQGVYWPLMVLAVASAVLQFVQSKQVTPKPTGPKKSFKQVMQAASKGEQVDQSELNAIMGQKMIILFPALAFMAALYLPGALVLFYAMSSLVAIWQQRQILDDDVEEMEEIVDKAEQKQSKKQKTAAQRAKQAKPAKTVKPGGAKPRKQNKRR